MSAEFKVEYLETQDTDGDTCVIPTVWIGNQGFDLREQYIDHPLTAQEKAEWFVSMFKKAIDSYAEAYHKAELEKYDDKLLIKKLFNYKFESNNAGKKRQRLRMEGAKMLLNELKQ